MRERLHRLVLDLCSDACAGRAPGTPGGRLARELVVAALRDAGLAPTEQPIARIGGANLVATLEGSGPLGGRTIVVGAHYDHLGVGSRGQIYRGADDNAAAVAILVEVARALVARRAGGRRIVLVAFDAEEPPHFLGPTMGSEVFAESGAVSLASVDCMIALDLVGHAIGPEGLPDAVRDSVFVLGAEKEPGLGRLVDARPVVPGFFARRIDADVIPPLSDYEAFRQRGVPFLFLSAGRSRVYHTPEDTPERLDFAKMEATARWLAGLVSELAEAPLERRFDPGRRDDRATLATIAGLARVLAPFSGEAARGALAAETLLEAAARRGLTPLERSQIAVLIGGLEDALS